MPKPFNNLNLPAATITLDRANLDKKLYVDNSMPWVVYLFLFYLGCFGLYGLYAMLMEYTNDGFDLSALGRQPLLSLLPFLAGLFVFVWFTFGLLRGALSSRPKEFKIQHHDFYGRFIHNLLGFLALTLIFASLVAGVIDVYRKGEFITLNDIKPHYTDLAPSLLFGFLFGLIGIYLWQMSLRYLFRIGGWFWNRVRLTALFDRESYAPGDTFRVRVFDRVSEQSQRRYRVHLSYVKEFMRQHKKSKAYAREIVTSAYRDVMAGELHRGIEWMIPKAEEERFTNFSWGQKPHYWEVLIEEHDSHFHARFFVDVRKE